MRLLRATVISVVGAAAVLLAPGVASADTGITQQECEPLWFWWIPLPCPHELPASTDPDTVIAGGCRSAFLCSSARPWRSGARLEERSRDAR